MNDKRPLGLLGLLGLPEGNNALDGLKVDKLGIIDTSGPGGVLIIAPEGECLDLIAPPERLHNRA